MQWSINYMSHNGDAWESGCAVVPFLTMTLDGGVTSFMPHKGGRTTGTH
jgi:hypothetical protein